MAHNVDFEYENEDSIDNNLKCGICSDPFLDPVVTPCHHSFCWQCLNSWLQTGKSTCPTCRKTVSASNSVRVTLLSFLSILDQLLVECKLCQQSKIQRGNFEHHINKVCPKAIVKCSASDIDCPWTGFREEFQTHLSTCTFVSARAICEAHTTEDQPEIAQPVQQRTRDLTTVFRIENIHVGLIVMTLNRELTDLSEEDLLASVKEVIQNKQCTQLNLFQRQLSPRTIAQITKTLTNDMSLRSLELGMCSMGNIGLISLSIDLPSDSCLEYLDLYGNSIADEGVQYLAGMLKRNSRLSRLRLAQNKISNNGVQMLADVLTNNKSKLERLSLVGNTNITDGCIYSIFSIIRYNRTLKILNLEGCNLSYYAQSFILFSQKLYLRWDLTIVL